MLCNCNMIFHKTQEHKNYVGKVIFFQLVINFSKFYGKVGVTSWLLFHLIWKNFSIENNYLCDFALDSHCLYWQHSRIRNVVQQSNSPILFTFLLIRNFFKLMLVDIGKLLNTGWNIKNGRAKCVTLFDDDPWFESFDYKDT